MIVRRSWCRPIRRNGQSHFKASVSSCIICLYISISGLKTVPVFDQGTDSQFPVEIAPRLQYQPVEEPSPKQPHTQIPSDWQDCSWFVETAPRMTAPHSQHQNPKPAPIPVQQNAEIWDNCFPFTIPEAFAPDTAAIVTPIQQIVPGQLGLQDHGFQ